MEVHRPEGARGVRAVQVPILGDPPGRPPARPEAEGEYRDATLMKRKRSAHRAVQQAIDAGLRGAVDLHYADQKLASAVAALDLPDASLYERVRLAFTEMAILSDKQPSLGLEAQWERVFAVFRRRGLATMGSLGDRQLLQVERDIRALAAAVSAAESA